MGGRGPLSGASVGERPDATPASFPKTPADRQAIRDQLERILANQNFQTSRRYSALLRYVVDHTLKGRADNLKERSIGIEVFGMPPDYDTNMDHRVRTVAGEVRKRLAQYYVEPGREGDIRIDLPLGSYVPLFRRPLAAEQTAGERALENEAPILAPITELQRPPEVSRIFGRRRIIIALACACLIVVVGLVWIRALPTASASDRFWAPVTSSPATVTMCLGTGSNDEPTNPDIAVPPPTLFEFHMQYEKVAFSDAVTLGRLTGFLKTKAKSFRILYAPQVTLADLRQGPSILIGAFDNDWTIRLAGPLRYTFQWDEAFSKSSIRDSKNPNRSDWKVDWRRPYRELTKDYAIVSRVLDPTTGEFLIVVAGLTKYGTLAAGEFLTNTNMNELDKYAPRDWKPKNLQVVLSVKVVQGSSGPPSVEAVYFW
jgi:hypothetical protein